MNEQDFPALYRSADHLSVASQRQFLDALMIHLITLVLAAFLSFVNIPHWSIAVLQLLALLGALACSIYLFASRPDRFWYTGRAVAESIKTLTWRYVCRAEPFQTNDESSHLAFTQKLRSVVEQNREVCEALTKHLAEEQFTARMEEIRSSPLEHRRMVYTDQRVKDQLAWYARKACFNRRRSKLFFRALVFINLAAVVCAALRIAHPQQPYWPTDIFVAIAASLLSWMQAKKFSELASSYALTAHEIGMIKDQSHFPMTDQEFSLFVGDAENAFSREHTQWVARKDA
ncbi:DUF4231 domain-containing protein [Achromobacter sp. MY14]|uniref:DUF4231 domain-containing protein n=1 Tax=unclassified Achromobacter TaxID=2626865 RepID=UPI001E390786|nr:DUF4231 domain-containing protein [Achromobacter sp. MY14]MCD0501257.1 DUF4231 domain-containing protein [Achromobacter sp. MY14]